jgi:hypothetical protein
MRRTKPSSIKYKKIDVQEKKTTIGEWFGLFLILIAILICFIVYVKYSTEERMAKIKLIKSDYEICKGVITKKFVYKGRTVDVEFKVRNIIYSGGDGVHIGKDKKVGDSIFIKYYVKNPSFFITELNDEYCSE